MPAQVMTQAKARETLELLARCKGNQFAAARESMIALAEMQTRIRRAQIVLAGARYRKTEKFKRARARYRTSAKGIAADKRSKARRVWLGRHYRGRVDTVERASVINAHIKERVSAFITRQQTGAETEGAPSCAISTQAEPRTN